MLCSLEEEGEVTVPCIYHCPSVQLLDLYCQATEGLTVADTQSSVHQILLWKEISIGCKSEKLGCGELGSKHIATAQMKDPS